MVDIDVISPAVASTLSDSTHTGVFAHGVANVSVTDVRAVPATFMKPELSFDGEPMLEVPPETVGCGPPVMTWLLLSIENVVLPDDEAMVNKLRAGAEEVP